MRQGPSLSIKEFAVMQGPKIASGDRRFARVDETNTLPAQPSALQTATNYTVRGIDYPPILLPNVWYPAIIASWPPAVRSTQAACDLLCLRLGDSQANAHGKHNVLQKAATARFFSGILGSLGDSDEVAVAESLMS